VPPCFFLPENIQFSAGIKGTPRRLGLAKAAVAPRSSDCRFPCHGVTRLQTGSWEELSHFPGPGLPHAHGRLASPPTSRHHTRSRMGKLYHHVSCAVAANVPHHIANASRKPSALPRHSARPVHFRKSFGRSKPETSRALANTHDIMIPVAMTPIAARAIIYQPRISAPQVVSLCLSTSPHRARAGNRTGQQSFTLFGRKAASAHALIIFWSCPWNRVCYRRARTQARRTRRERSALHALSVKRISSPHLRSYPKHGTPMLRILPKSLCH